MVNRTNHDLQNTTQKTKDGTTFETHKKPVVISTVAGINGTFSLKSAQAKWRGKYVQLIIKASREETRGLPIWPFQCGQQRPDSHYLVPGKVGYVSFCVCTCSTYYLVHGP